MRTKGKGVIFFTNVEALKNLEHDYDFNLEDFRYECDIEVANGVAEILTGKGKRFTFGSGYIIRWVDDK